MEPSDRYFLQRTISDQVLSPNGKLAAFVSSKVFREKDSVVESEIVVMSTETGREVARHGSKGMRCYSPAFSDDSTHIAFCAKEKSRYFLLTADLDESEIPVKIEVPCEVWQMQFIGNSDLLFLMREPDPQGTKEKRQEGYDAYFYEEISFTSLYRYSPSSGIQKLTDEVQIWEFSADGNLAVAVISDDPNEGSWYRSKLALIDLSSGKITSIYDPGFRGVSRPVITSDHSRIYFLESLWSDRGVTSGDLIQIDIRTRNTVNLTEGAERSYVDVQSDGNRTLALWLHEGTCGLSDVSRISDSVWEGRYTPVPGFAPKLSVRSGYYLLALTSGSDPQEVYLLSTSLKKLSSENRAIEDRPAYPTELIHWKSSDGLEIYGFLRSLGPEKPIVVYVHGGPTSFSYPSFIDRTTAFLDSGFSVFMPNYRGSTGKGRKYAESNIGDMGGMDFQDILAGVKFLRDSGRIVTENVFITGGSYGGFMTQWAITQTDIFRAGVALFGISNWVSFHGTTNIPDWDEIHYNQDAYKGGVFSKFSPLNYAERVSTPLLIMQGEIDPCVPPGQSLEFYRILKERGKSVRLLMFPREGHGFTERAHIIQQQNETIEWFRKFMTS
ncbi:MAG TPA: S9 family peptidase [Thermoplasmataceae archaeon]|nr:S9 family peptidase [Thermoplasmatales archaeon AK]HLH85837.1 S9 family peptidase [Thermoplasmataceae archaeon]